MDLANRWPLWCIWAPDQYLRSLVPMLWRSVVFHSYMGQNARRGIYSLGTCVFHEKKRPFLTRMWCSNRVPAGLTFILTDNLYRYVMEVCQRGVTAAPLPHPARLASGVPWPIYEPILVCSFDPYMNQYEKVRNWPILVFLAFWICCSPWKTTRRSFPEIGQFSKLRKCEIGQFWFS